MSWSSPPTPGCVSSERVEDLGREDVAADRGQVRRRLLGRGLLDDRADAREVLVLDQLGLDAAVERDLVAADLHRGEDAAPVPLVHAEHLLQQRASARRSGRRPAAPRTARRRRGPRPPPPRARGRADPAGGCSGSPPCREISRTSFSSSYLPLASRKCSSSKDRSKWSSIARLPRPVMMRMSVSPAWTASSTTYWIAGLSRTRQHLLGLGLGRRKEPGSEAGRRDDGFSTFVIAPPLRGAGVYPQGATRRPGRPAGDTRIHLPSCRPTSTNAPCAVSTSRSSSGSPRMP